MPYNWSPTFSKFLKTEFNNVAIDVTGDQVNQIAGYGKKHHAVIYCLYGPKPYTNKVGTVVESLDAK